MAMDRTQEHESRAPLMVFFGIVGLSLIFFLAFTIAGKLGGGANSGAPLPSLPAEVTAPQVGVKPPGSGDATAGESGVGELAALDRPSIQPGTSRVDLPAEENLSQGYLRAPEPVRKFVQGCH